MVSSKKTKRKKAKTSSKKKNRPNADGKSRPKPAGKASPKPSISLTTPYQARIGMLPIPTQDHRVFSIELRAIDGETTIGDLIVAFPRTRDVLVKHGLRFDVEEAGYLYMTLNVFSAIHGVDSNTLVQELHTASKEPPPQPTAQPVRPITVSPTT